MHLDAIDDRVIQTLMSAPAPTVLLPNLRTLHWLDNRERFFPLLRTLLGPTITSVQLGRDHLRSSSFAKSALLASLSVRCPFIREFSCMGFHEGSKESLDVICEALYGWRELSYLDTGVLNAQALVHLASLSSLKSLCCETCDLNDMQPNSIPTFTHQLDDVSISTPSLSALVQYLRNIRFLSCRWVQLWIDEDEPYDPLDIPDLIVSLSKVFSPDLEQLGVSFGFKPDPEERHDPRFAIAFDAVTPLLSLSRLTSLELSWLCTSAIDDGSLKILAQAWPQLEEFHFGGGICWLVPPSLTFIGLIHLVQHCRRLHTIGMTFHANSIDTNSELFSKIIPNKNITSMDAGVSPIVDPLAVACQLHALLPNLTNVFTLNSFKDISPLPAVFENLEAGWQSVNTFLNVLITGAKIKEKINQGPY